MNTADFKRLLAVCSDLSQQFDHEIVFIGGIAVYLHAIHIEEIRPLAETTHDADFYISMAALSDLRDIEEVTPNLRLSRHQIMKQGFEFDIYTEHHTNLIVPYADIRAHTHSYDIYQVAALEHLLALKLEAYANRRRSSKGQKDAKDLIRICLCGQHLGFDSDLYRGYELDHHQKLLQEVISGSAVIELAAGNSHLAKSYRTQATTLFHAIYR